MARVEESDLPGVGTRYSFETADHRSMGVIQHHDGRRELFVCDQYDPDCVATSVSLEEGEAHVLADILGGTELSRDVAAATQTVAGLVLDWVGVADGADGTSIADHQVRTRTGASVVAVLRDGEPHPAPGPEFVLHSGDTALVVGTSKGVKEARALLCEEAS